VAKKATKTGEAKPSRQGVWTKIRGRRRKKKEEDANTINQKV